MTFDPLPATADEARLWLRGRYECTIEEWYYVLGVLHEKS